MSKFAVKAKQDEPLCNDLATLAAGCFWGVQRLFSQIEGVVETVAGYSGGQQAYPSYRQVCGGLTGHAEAVRIEYQPDLVSYRELLELFFTMHDPTTINRQGPDVGPQYRSVIFFHNHEQQRLALEAFHDHSKRFADPIVTEIVPAGPFYPAEQYHQHYYRKRYAASCQV